MKTPRSRAATLCLVAVLAVPAACYVHSRQHAFDSNFAKVRIERDRIVDAKTGRPFSGTLVARDAELLAIAPLALRGTPLAEPAGLDAAGLILVLAVDTGLPSGKAALHADLRAPRLSRELSRHPFSVAVARKVAPTVKLAEATFVGGKLEGTATLLAPGHSGRLGKTAEVSFSAGLPHGTAREYFPGTTQVKREVTFERGERSGAQRTFYGNGARRSHATFDHGRSVGTAESWFPDGTRESETVFAADGTISKITAWYSNGKLAMSFGPDGEVRHPPDGVITEYYASGRRWEQSEYTAGVRTGAQRKWWTNGRLALEVTWVDGALHGTSRRWYASGKLWEQATYDHGKPIGRQRKWWKNGKLAVDARFKGGKLDGDYLAFYDSGARWEMSRHAEGKPVGIHRRWFPDGRLGYIKHHAGGRPDGAFKRWWADGKPRLEATYVAGRLHGEFRNWLEDGSEYEMARYDQGKLLETTRAATP